MSGTLLLLAALVGERIALRDKKARARRNGVRQTRSVSKVLVDWQVAWRTTSTMCSRQFRRLNQWCRMTSTIRESSERSSLRSARLRCVASHSRNVCSITRDGSNRPQCCSIRNHAFAM